MSLLVNYDSTDSEDNCNETSGSTQVISKQIKVGTVNHYIASDKNNEDVPSTGTHTKVKSLPTPMEVNSQDIIILPSKKELTFREKPPALVTNNKIVFNLPSIENSDSEDDSGPPPKKLHLEPKSSMLGQLPKPKHIKAKETDKPLIPHSIMKKASVSTPEQIDYDEDDSDEDSDWVDVGKGMNFLMPGASEENAMEFHESALYRYQEDESCLNTNALASYQQETPQISIPQEFVRDQQFQKIMLSKDVPGADIIEVSLDEHLGKYEAERLKDITRGPAMGSNLQKPTGQVNPQSRRKHQITYLALQAKEREFELKNQWAENKFNKRQTQSKYGF